MFFFKKKKKVGWGISRETKDNRENKNKGT